MSSEIPAWLLEESNPSVRFWALQDLMGYDLQHSEVVEAQEKVMESNIVKSILKAQNEEGFWVSEKNMYLPKYTATTHSLLILAELGARRTPNISRGMEQIFRFQRNSGHFLTELPTSVKGRASSVKDGSCLDANILHYAIWFGYLEDQRTQNLIDFIVGYHDFKNAGWKCRSYPINPAGVFPINCYMGSVKTLKALSMIPTNARTDSIKKIIEKETENILENSIYRYLRNSDGSRKDKAGWKRFGFPLFYQSDILEVLDTLTRLGLKDNRMDDSINLLTQAMRPDDKWLLENTFNGKMWANIDEKGKSSKWITLRALRILKRYNS